jgi:hypothetical protein
LRNAVGLRAAEWSGRRLVVIVYGRTVADKKGGHVTHAGSGPRHRHPLVQHKLGLMRMKSTGTSAFRSLLAEIGMLMAYEVARDLPTRMRHGRDAVGADDRARPRRQEALLISIMRAGAGILDGMLRVLPNARSPRRPVSRRAHLAAVEYYFKMPKAMSERDAVVVDPMLATGHSAVARGRSPEGDAAALDQVRVSGHVSRRADPSPRPSSRRPVYTDCPSTATSTATATSCRASATPATAFSERSKLARLYTPRHRRPIMRLQEQVAIVTGAGAGVGKAVALRYAREGARVVVAEIDETSGEKTTAEIVAAPSRPSGPSGS